MSKSLADLIETIKREMSVWHEYHTSAEYFMEYNNYAEFHDLSEVPEELETNWKVYNLREIAAKLIAEQYMELFERCPKCGDIFESGFQGCDCSDNDDEETEDEENKYGELTERDFVDYLLMDCFWSFDRSPIDTEKIFEEIIKDAYEDDVCESVKLAIDKLEEADNPEDLLVALLAAAEVQHHNGDLLEDYCKEEWELIGKIRQNGLESVYSREEIDEFLGLELA